MTEEAELHARIAAIAGKINQRKQQPHHGSRWAPYGRGGAFKNRTLVNGLVPAKHEPDIATGAHPGSEKLVSTRGTTNKQLMTKDTYDREQKQRTEMKEQQRAAKRQKRNTEEQHRILRHVDASGIASREMVVEGIRFKLSPDGSKLMRVPGKQDLTNTESPELSVADSSTLSKDTPKRSKVAGVEFYRTKHGNLVRASALIGAARYRQDPTAKVDVLMYCRPIKQTPQCEHFTRNGTLHDQAGHGEEDDALANSLWFTDVSVGTCPFGPSCRFTHDPCKVAICKDYQKAGSCPRGANCDLSHEMTYHRVPACAFFVRGNCTNTACRYPHINVSPAAPVCRAFATLGFCARGADCDKRHVIECPDYANHGICANRESGKCTLPHPDRASILRKAAERQAKLASDEASDLSSDDEDLEGDVEDVDSDAEDVIMGNDTHEMTQQRDFVAFS